MSEPTVPAASDPARAGATAVRAVAVVARNGSREAVTTAGELVDWLRRRDLSVALDAASLRALPQSQPDLGAFDPASPYDLVLVLGGDGTLLSVARSLEHDVPILGINLGRLGFLTEIGRGELYPRLATILRGDFAVEERSLFAVELLRRDRVDARYRAFNDAVINKSALARIIELRLEIAGALVARYRSDGLIVSTPSGSTAYNLSAGGPIVNPDLRVAVLTPICPHALALRPIVVPDTVSIEVTLETDKEEVFLTVDGQEGKKMQAGDTVKIRRAETMVRLVRASGRSFYDNLREKLKWGG